MDLKRRSEDLDNPKRIFFGESVAQTRREVASYERYLIEVQAGVIAVPEVFFIDVLEHQELLSYQHQPLCPHCRSHF